VFSVNFSGVPEFSHSLGPKPTFVQVAANDRNEPILLDFCIAAKVRCTFRKYS